MTGCLDQDIFSRTALLLGDNSYSNLVSARVLLVGVGGVGSYAAEALVRAGIGNLTLIDGDVVQASNINRQLHALTTTIGLPKVAVMAERLLLINPALPVSSRQLVVTPEDIPQLLAEPYDLVLDAIDSFDAKLALISGCVVRDIPVIASMGAAGKLDPARVRCADLAESHGCRLARKLRKLLRREGITHGVRVIYSDETFASHGFGEKEPEGDVRRPMGSISYLPALFGLHMAAEAVRLLLKKKDKPT
jgi:tRNA A37 threonylcarbamoyladenosine dehydratase